jgi:RND family efflux transporter MFP subunit
MNIDKTALRPVLILVGGVALAGALIASSGEAEKTTVERPPLLVTATAIEQSNMPIPVRGTGTVVAAQQVSLVPQVGGKIIETDARLMPGGRFTAGETLARIEPRDHQATLDLARSNAQRAELELSLEQGRSDVAKREWELLRDDGSSPSDLALRKPQLALAEQSVTAARGALTAAQLNFSRTRLRAPFNAVVINESIDLGQVVGPGNPIATLVGTDRLWVNVSLPLAEMDVLQLEARDGVGSAAVVLHRLADGRQLRFEGVALQMGGALDPATRQAQVTVAIDNPFDQKEVPLPLLPGAYVEVIFEGLIAQEVSQIPRSALHNGDTAWVSVDGILTPRKVTISGGDIDNVLVGDGFEEGDLLVTTALSLPLEGTAVQIIGDDQ